ncbi:MAG: YlxR family protein [Propionibacteriales bacterium]|nr:YlxR family protein [Propionibacteriales bacterium]
MSSTPPVRTCVGCRERTTKSNLLRVVADVRGPQVRLMSDEQARRPGRGAYLHPSHACLDLAERRRAFPRALRLEGPLDTNALRSWIVTRSQSSPEAPGTADDRLG